MRWYNTYIIDKLLCMSNIGFIDRSIRFVFGVALGIFAFYGMNTGTSQNIAYIVSFVLILMGMVGFCPLYAVFGIHAGCGCEGCIGICDNNCQCKQKPKKTTKRKTENLHVV